jgi:poly[(R)-3-hydroxyalkanoate] polymerase subunit PhaC
MNTEETFLNHLANVYSLESQLEAINYEYNERELIYKYNKIKLYHYPAKKKISPPIPLLMVFATVNRPEILDLFPETSFVHCLITKGIDVYFLDWGYPTTEDQKDNMQDYITRYLHQCISYILNKRGIKKISLLGICQGGLLSICYASLFETIKNLILISTPIDFNVEKNIIAKIIKKIDLIKINDILAENFPGKILNQFFISLRPIELLIKKYFNFIKNIDNQEKRQQFLKVEKWLNDVPDQAAYSFLELLTKFYQENQLILGRLYLANQKIDLNNLKIPIFNIMAKNDEIVPISSSKQLKKYIHPEYYYEKILKGGHISIYINKATTQYLAQTIISWLKKN